jgi:hypothetical protein
MSLRITRRAALTLLTVVLALPAWSAHAVPSLPPLTSLASRHDIPRDGVQVRLVTGSADWRRGQSAWQAIQPDQMLREGDELRTGRRGMIVLELPLQAGFVNVLADSVLAVREMRRLPGFEGPQSATLMLNGGKAFVRLRRFNRRESRFRVISPNGSAVVRGTEFVVASVVTDGRPTTTIGVTSGLVQVEAQGRTVDVPPGRTSTIVGTGTPTAAKESPAVPIRLTRFLPQGDYLHIVGKAAPGASIVIDGVQSLADTDGTFQARIHLGGDARQITIESLEPTGHVETLSVAAGE